MAIGDLARKAPPPDELVKGAGAAPEAPDEDDAAAGVGMAEEVLTAIKGGDAQVFKEALDAYLDSRRG